MSLCGCCDMVCGVAALVGALFLNRRSGVVGAPIPDRCFGVVGAVEFAELAK